MTSSKRIDAHQHFWQIARGDYRWLQTGGSAVAPLARDFLPAQLQPALNRCGVGSTVLVQAADTRAETEYLLALADAHPVVAAVVGWVDLAQLSSVSVLETWSSHVAFRGVRPMLQDLAETDWIAHGPAPEVLAALSRLNLSFDALVTPRHLDGLRRFVQAQPSLQVVIDHAAKPALAAGWDAAWVPGWRRAMAALARQPQVCCKFSGLLAEMSPADRLTPATVVAALRPVWDSLLEWFGPSRLMWGSDWPVLNLAGSYELWSETSETLIGELTPDEQAQVWHGTAARFYRLTGRATV